MVMLYEYFLPTDTASPTLRVRFDVKVFLDQRLVMPYGRGIFRCDYYIEFPAAGKADTSGNSDKSRYLRQLAAFFFRAVLWPARFLLLMKKTWKTPSGFRGKQSESAALRRFLCYITFIICVEQVRGSLWPRPESRFLCQGAWRV